MARPCKYSCGSAGTETTDTPVTPRPAPRATGRDSASYRAAPPGPAERRASTDGSRTVATRASRVAHGCRTTKATGVRPEHRKALVVFLANPFGAETLRRVLDRVVARRGQGDIVVVYFNPVHADVFDDYPALQVHERGTDWVVYRLAAPEVTA